MQDRRAFLASSAALAGGLWTNSLSADEKSGLGTKSKFAVNVEMWWSKLPFLKRLEEAAKVGFDAVEFWPWRGKDLNAVIDTLKKNKLSVTQFTAWGFKPGMNDPANHQKFVDEVGASCEVAKKLDCKMMTVVGGDDIQGKSQEQMHEAIIEALKKAAPVAEKAGILLILEPMNIKIDHKGHCLYGSEPSVKIIKAVNSKFVKLNWDLYHMYVQEGDLIGHLKGNMEHAGYFQIADHPGRNEPGTGEVDYPKVLKYLYDNGYRGYIGLECRPKKPEAEAVQGVIAADKW